MKSRKVPPRLGVRQTDVPRRFATSRQIPRGLCSECVSSRVEVTLGCWINIKLQYPFNFTLLPFASRTLTSSSQMAISSQYS